MNQEDKGPVTEPRDSKVCRVSVQREDPGHVQVLLDVCNNLSSSAQRHCGAEDGGHTWDWPCSKFLPRLVRAQVRARQEASRLSSGGRGCLGFHTHSGPGAHLILTTTLAVGLVICSSTDEETKAYSGLRYAQVTEGVTELRARI